MTSAIDTGLATVIAAQTRLSDVQGAKGELTIAGFRVEDIAPFASFEEMVFLLLNDRLPDASELETFQGELADAREIPGLTISLLRGAVDKRVSTMDALLMAAATLGMDSGSATNDVERQGMLVVARFPTIVAAYYRMLNGLDLISPKRDLGHAANYVYMLSGDLPSDDHVRALQTYLNTVIDHGLNASTFAARVITATHSDVFSAITGAVGALKGPLHGGAPGPALNMVFEIGEIERAESHMRAMLDRGERLMGFGHRVYKVRDPRADVLAGAARTLYESGTGDQALYQLAVEVEHIALRLLEEYKPGRNLQTNVEYYTALLLHCLGFQTELFTPTFAISRVAGWVAHYREQLETGRLIRPGSEYIGSRDRRRIPLGER